MQSRHWCDSHTIDLSVCYRHGSKCTPPLLHSASTPRDGSNLFDILLIEKPVQQNISHPLTDRLQVKVWHWPAFNKSLPGSTRENMNIHSCLSFLTKNEKQCLIQTHTQIAVNTRQCINKNQPSLQSCIFRDCPGTDRQSHKLPV